MRKLFFLILILFLPSMSLMHANSQNSPKNEEDDELASIWIHYADKFILGVNDNQVTLRKYSLGDIELIIMPEMI